MSEKLIISRLPPIDSLQTSPHGTSYTIGGSPIRHNLPPPAALKPYQDTKAGYVDTWPAHTSANGSAGLAMYLTKDRQLVVQDGDMSGLRQITPKPKFLRQLEQFLHNELRRLGASDGEESSELRLQAHREVFEYLIEDFKTYKPLLASIKNEYETALTLIRNEVRRLEPLQQMLVTVTEQCERKIMDQRDLEKEEIRDLKAENRRLYQQQDELRNGRQSLEVQVDRLREELAVQYLLYRDECDARKLLIIDINDLRGQLEEYTAPKQAALEAMGGPRSEDSVTLRIALKQAREDEAAASAKLNEMVANYGDVIPRRDYETLKKEYELLESKIDLVKDDFKTLQKEHDSLIDVHKIVVQQRDEFYVESETLKRTATPRPDWQKCGESVPGGMERWHQLTQGQTSRQILDVLITELQDSDGQTNVDLGYFDGLGVGREVPLWLQFEGKVRNRRMNKRDTLLLIHDVWIEKAISDAEKKEEKRERLDVFLHQYMKQHFGLDQMVVEWSYNFRDALQRFAKDDRVRFFNAVLNDEADEELRHEELETLSKLGEFLAAVDGNKDANSSLLREDFNTALSEFFSLKDPEAVASLVRAAVVDLNLKDDDRVTYKDLFMEDDLGQVGPFLDELKKQITEEREKYVEDIKTEIANGDGPVTVNDLQSAITATDPYTDKKEMEEYLLRAFRVETKAGLDSVEPVDLDTIVNRLKLGNLRRAGIKP